MSASVLINGEATESFEVKTGVKQGCVLAPGLFSIFISVHLFSERLPQGIDLHYRLDGKLFNLRRPKAKTLVIQMTILEFQYADDNAIVSHTEQGLQAAMDAFNYEVRTTCKNINHQRSRLMNSALAQLTILPILAAAFQIRRIWTLKYNLV